MPMIHFLHDAYRDSITAFIDGVPAYGEGATKAAAASDLKIALRWLTGLVAERFPARYRQPDQQQRAWEFIDRPLDAAAAGRNAVPDPSLAAVLDNVMKQPLPAASRPKLFAH